VGPAAGGVAVTPAQPALKPLCGLRCSRAGLGPL